MIERMSSGARATGSWCSPAPSSSLSGACGRCDSSRWVDAVPDISDVQVIVSTEWSGRSPDLIEDQVTYPIVSALISTPRVRNVRGFTDFGISRPIHVGCVVEDHVVWFGRWSAGSLAFAVLLGALIGAAVEWWGLSTGRWNYDDTMPRVPGLELGIVPIVQIGMVAPLTFWIAARWLNRPGAVNP